jgi:hypothetical protein
VTLIAINLRKLVAKSLRKLNKLVLSPGDAAGAMDLAGLAVPHVIDTRALSQGGNSSQPSLEFLPWDQKYRVLRSSYHVG